MPERTDQAFRPLADPRRRRILDLLSEKGPPTLGQLVRATRQGRTERYEARPEVLGDALAPWLAKHAPYCDDVLSRLRRLAEGSSTPD